MTSFFETIIAHEGPLRLTFFIGTFLLMAILEFAIPRRDQKLGRVTRWPSNLSLVILDTLLIRFLVPMTAVGVALYAQQINFGVFNLFDFGPTLSVLISIILLDLAIYGQHVLFHSVPLLWRLHRVHHADTEFDVTTGLRFHPVEIFLSLFIKFAVIMSLGVPAAAVVIFEILLNGSAMFNHSNIKLPAWLDKPLSWIVVTPDMHRVHHSSEKVETDSNFGFNLPWWDFVFGTYRAYAKKGQLNMVFGIDEFRDPSEQRLQRMLTQPFRTDKHQR
jgi:sterol desaturase/sphingolipid hydroxylase (fatty acid hydroxylase superfamily)